MEYITRELEPKFQRMSESFKAVLVVGARQVGKSTMLARMAVEQGRTIVTMDDSRNRELARTDPKLFFQMYQPPILIDEVQKAPELFEEIKMMCDASEEKGRFWLTGSQSKKLLKEAGDSLAGRICILHMYSLSQREKAGLPSAAMTDFSLLNLMEREKAFDVNNIAEIFDHIYCGGMPEVLQMDEEQRSAYYNSYIDTYLMRDAVDDNGIQDTVGFRKALRACAAFAGNQLNYSDIANAADVSVTTVKAWIKVLENMGIIYLLEPFYNNELKRLTKTPKLYFCDTGLCAYLSMWTSRDALMNGAASGHYFENYVVGELMRGYAYSAKDVNMTFYRDQSGREIDLIIEENGCLHPIEIKRSASPEKKSIRNFDILQKTSKEIGAGGVICMTDRVFPIDEKNTYIPCNLI